MFGQTPPEVGCIDGSIESLCSGGVAGAVYGWVFRETFNHNVSTAKNAFAAVKNSGKVAFIAGTWCFYGSCASCALTRAGLSDMLAAAGAGFVAGSAVGMQLRLDPKMLVLVTGSSVFVSLTASAAGAPPTQAQERHRQIYEATTQDNKRKVKIIHDRSDRPPPQPPPAAPSLFFPPHNICRAVANKFRRKLFGSLDEGIRIPT